MLKLLKSIRNKNAGFTFFRRKKADPVLESFLRFAKNSTGFTLIELLIVIVIIVIVIAVGAVSYTTVARNGRNASRAAELAHLEQALETYRADHGTYIPTGSGGSYWGPTGGEFEGAGRDCLGAKESERFCCLLGGSFAARVEDVETDPITGNKSIWVCEEPTNVYISSDPKIRRDDLIEDTDAWNPGAYIYASDGLSYALLTIHYEGAVPAGHRLTDSPFYYCEALQFQPSIDWSNAYVVYGGNIRQPTNGEKTFKPGWSTCS